MIFCVDFSIFTEELNLNVLKDFLTILGTKVRRVSLVHLFELMMNIREGIIGFSELMAVKVKTIIREDAWFILRSLKVIINERLLVIWLIKVISTRIGN